MSLSEKPNPLQEQAARFCGKQGTHPSEGARRYFPVFFSVPLGWKVLNIGLLTISPLSSVGLHFKAFVCI